MPISVKPDACHDCPPSIYYANVQDDRDDKRGNRKVSGYCVEIPRITTHGTNLFEFAENMRRAIKKYLDSLSC